MSDLIIIGASTRAAAQSAIRAGFTPWCIDLFADRDLRAVAHVKKCDAARWPVGVLDLLHDAPDAPVLFTGAMENHLAVVRGIEQSFSLFGPGSEQIKQMRDPSLLDGVWLEKQLPREGRWLLKHRRSAGGSGVRVWRGEPVDEQHYLQMFYPGEPLSVVLRGDGHAWRVVGITQQIIGDDALGAKAFHHAGNVMLDASAAKAASLRKACDTIIKTLPAPARGIIGLDLIDTPGPSKHELKLIEINPRYTAAVELIERAQNITTLPPQGGGNSLPPSSPPVPSVPKKINAKAIAYARTTCTVPDLCDIFAQHDIADVPDADTVIPKGRPICTLFSNQGLNGLHTMADQLYTHLA